MFACQAIGNHGHWRGLLPPILHVPFLQTIPEIRECTERVGLCMKMRLFAGHGDMLFVPIRQSGGDAEEDS